MTKPLPTQEYLATILRYEPDTGLLFWLERPTHLFNSDDSRGPQWAANAWNAHHAGKPAFTAVEADGYRQGKIDGIVYQAHRVIWKLVYGVDPDTIDHINGSQGDNRLQNLRDCSIAENSRNYSKAPGGSSKYRGVCWVKRDQSWAARISAGRKISLGNFKTEEEAARAYDRGAREHHGAFAVLNFPEES